ncbi:MAG: hypothetical protein ACI9NT_001024, partial [Bacteroidia bacterium]
MPFGISTRTSMNSKYYHKEIDGLRAVSVLAIIL